jgi:hypothetical protein
LTAFRSAKRLEGLMHQAANMQFERAVSEFARWRAIPEKARPDAWCASLELPEGSTYGDGVEVFLSSLADQTTLPWPGGFPGDATVEAE